MPLAGLDIGTSGCKCGICDEEGLELATAYSAYSSASRRDTGRHEIDAETLWSSVKAVIAQAVLRAGRRPSALCVSSFGETCVVLDRDGQPLIPAFLYTDNRGADEIAALAEEFGGERLFNLGGHRAGSMYTLAKLLWAGKNLPDALRRADAVLPIASLAVYRLTGRRAVDPSLASRTMLFDIHSRRWSEELLSRAGVPRAAMPEVVDIGTVVGAVTPEIAGELGLDAGTRVVMGAQDQIVAAIGAGALSPGSAVNGSGSVECVTPVFAELPDGDAFYRGNYATVPMLPGRYVTYAFMFTGGVLLDWARRNLSESGRAPAELDAAGTAMPTGILALPHFAGAATPYMDTGSRGAIVGLDLQHGLADVYRALQEGLCYESLLNIRRLAEAGVAVDELTVTGGGARSRVWCQMKADVYGIPCVTLENSEVGATGSAMLAGVATGVYATLEEAASRLVRKGETYRPRRHLTEAYAECFARYAGLYSALRPLV